VHSMSEGHPPAGIYLDAEGRVGLRRDVVGTVVLKSGLIDRNDAELIDLLARDQPITIGGDVVVRHHDVALEIDGNPAPVDAAIVSRELDPPIGGWRGVHAFVNTLAILDTAPKLIERRHAPHVAFLDVRLEHIREIDYKRLSGRQPLRFNPALGHGSLFYFDQQFAGAAIKDPVHGLLGRQDQRRNRAVLCRKINQGALCAQVVVPNIIMGGLIVQQ
jgi:hypothetical protein